MEKGGSVGLLYVQNTRIQDMAEEPKCCQWAKAREIYAGSKGIVFGEVEKRKQRTSRDEMDK